MQPNWNAIRSHYARYRQAILAERKDLWAIDPYAWEFEGGIRMTPIERWLWSDIRCIGAVLYPQYPVGRFFVDFANPVARVAIECDGAAFHSDKEKDAARDLALLDMGWTVYRITGSECMKDEDPETGKQSEAHNFIRDIARAHSILLNCQANRLSRVGEAA